MKAYWIATEILIGTAAAIGALSALIGLGLFLRWIFS